LLLQGLFLYEVLVSGFMICLS